MNDRSGHIKDTTQDQNNYRQFIINCYGPNDQRKYFSLAPFGIDFIAPENTRSLVTDSANKDIQYNLGVLNKIRIEDLAAGECVIFSTDDAGEELKGTITLRNTGNIEINKGLGGVEIELLSDGKLNIVTKGKLTINVTGDVDIDASGNATIDATQVNVNNGNLTVD